ADPGAPVEMSDLLRSGLLGCKHSITGARLRFASCTRVATQKGWRSLGEAVRAVRLVLASCRPSPFRLCPGGLVRTPAAVSESLEFRKPAPRLSKGRACEPASVGQAERLRVRLGASVTSAISVNPALR